MISTKRVQSVLVDNEKETAEFDWPLFKQFLRYLKPHLKGLVVMYALALINVVSTVTIPVVLQIGIDRHIAEGDVGGLAVVSGVLIALLVVLYLSARGQGVLMVKIGYRVLYALRRDLFERLQYLSFRYFDKERAGKIMSRLTNDVQELEELMRAGLDTIVVDAFMILGIIVAMFTLDARLALILLFTVPAFALLVFVLRSRILRAGRQIQRKLGSVNAFLNESISGIKVIRAFAREEENGRMFREINGDYYDQTRRFYPLIAIFWQSVATLSTIGPAMVLAGGGILLAQGTITLGVIAAFLTYINRFFQPMQKISNMLNQLSRAMASTERIFEIINHEVDVDDAPDALRDVTIHGEVEFRHVWFAYEHDEYVGRDLSFHVSPGETVAFVGPTGAGKTTIINLICRFYDPVAGTVRVDGHDLRTIAQSTYRSQIAVVMQDTRIFSGTVIDNIRFSKPEATDEEVREVARRMSIHDMIESMPDGYYSEIGESGGSLSLGQKQPLAFARALLRDPSILILDEASSYLDSQTEELVQKAMSELSRGRTTFVIAHRLATIRDADRIVVMEDGAIVESGSHTELVRSGGAYARLLNTQYSVRT
ncbi:MAG: ABC transporter ATP-binding protein [Spirochaetia bacterium]